MVASEGVSTDVCIWYVHLEAFPLFQVKPGNPTLSRDLIQSLLSMGCPAAGYLQTQGSASTCARVTLTVAVECSCHPSRQWHGARL